MGKGYSTDKPHCAQIEMVRGCNILCDFCALRTLPRERQYISMDIVKKAALELSVFDPIRLEFAMRGEPLLHPQWSQILREFKLRMPKSSIMLTTNGITLTPDKVLEFFNAGGNVLMVDCYGEGTYERRKQEYKEFNPVYYYEEEFHLYQRYDTDLKKLVLVDDISKHSGDRMQRILQNQAGNVDFDKLAKWGVYPIKEPYRKKCARPFRELVMQNDGRIALCCLDWKCEVPVWDIRNGRMAEFWKHGTQMNAARRLLYNKERDWGICKRCDYGGGFRLGLLKPQTPIKPDEMDALKRVAEGAR